MVRGILIRKTLNRYEPPERLNPILTKTESKTDPYGGSILDLRRDSEKELDRVSFAQGKFRSNFEKILLGSDFRRFLTVWNLWKEIDDGQLDFLDANGATSKTKLIASDTKLETKIEINDPFAQNNDETPSVRVS